MVTTVNAGTVASLGQGYDGVVRVSVAGYYGTGAVLYDGRAVLTAAHLFDSAGAATPVTVNFQTTAGVQSLTSTSYLIHPAYDSNGNNDLALVWLSQAAPIAANRYNLYRNNDELGQNFTLLGYGKSGTGSSGSQSTTDNTVRRLANNEFDALGDQLKASFGSQILWNPTAGTQLLADFDNGNTQQDALGLLLGDVGTGLGVSEGLIAPGDSGGPALLQGKLAGIASYVTSLSSDTIHPDIDTVINSSFGEVAAWQRASAYQQWIDQSLRAHYTDAPTQVSEVKKVVSEGNSGTSYAYFLLSFDGIRTNSNDWLSVDYSTRNGTAIAGQDYLPVSGKLIIYPGNNQAVIPVEIISDNIREPDEDFYLDVTNPVGGDFSGQIKLTAVRTIANDDMAIF